MGLLSSDGLAECVNALSSVHASFRYVGLRNAVCSRIDLIHLLLRHQDKWFVRKRADYDKRSELYHKRKRYPDYGDQREYPEHLQDHMFLHLMEEKHGDIIATRAYILSCLGDLIDIRDRLDINYTIDHVSPDTLRARELLDRYTTRRLYAVTGYARHPVVDVFTERLAEMLKRSRIANYRSRVQEEIEYAAREGWFVVFDTLTISQERKRDFFADSNAVRDHVRRIGRLVNRAYGRPARDSYADVFRFFCVPEYGTKNDRLHFHLVYFLKKLPPNSQDPNILGPGHYREISSMKVWKYGFSTPIAVRFSGDAFTKAGWRWPLKRENGSLVPIDIKPPSAVASYVTKYVQKNVGIGATQCQTIRRQFRIRMSRGFGNRLPPMTLFSDSLLTQLARLHPSVSKHYRMIRHQASATLRSRLGQLSMRQFLQMRKPRKTLLSLLRDMTQKKPPHSLPNSGTTTTPLLLRGDLSDDALEWIDGLAMSRRRHPVSAAA